MKLRSLGLQIASHCQSFAPQTTLKGKVQVDLLVELRDKLLEFTDDKVAAIRGPVGVTQFLLIIHLSIVSDNDATTIFKSVNI